MTQAGDSDAQKPPEEADFSRAYEELRALAEAHFRLQPASHTLQPTALVHEAYMRIASSSGKGPSDQEHLLATASRAMRQVLVDHARRKHAIKRGGSGGARLTLSDVGTDASEWDVLELNDAIDRLEQLDERQARIVELRFFGGLSVEQAAQVLGISERTVYLDWKMARGWLWSELRRDGA